MHCVMMPCRRRPFLIRPLENTLVKLILSLEFYSQEGRQKIAISAFQPRSEAMRLPLTFGVSRPISSPQSTTVAEEHTTRIC